MCGIFGIIRQDDGPVSPNILEQAIELVRHRGPDARGIHTVANWGFAHTRLAIIDLSKQGNQPLAYGDYLITYNGEIYNYIELRQELQKLGYSFATQTDTEVILAAYQYWGPACVEHFNGMWSLAIYDPARQQIFCSRDRFGIKPFYYLQSDRRFCWASEIKQFKALPDWQASVDKVSAFEFLVKGYHDHHEATFFEGVRQLRAGHNLVYDLRKHRYTIDRYYDIRGQATPQESVGLEEAVHQFRELFFDAIRLRLRSDVALGTALSGGLDSSSIVCGMQHLLEQNSEPPRQESVSCCFEDSRYDESTYVDAVAQKTGLQAHKVFPWFDAMMQNWETVSWYQDEPIASASVIAQYEVFKTAKAKGLTVMLDGQGADEILGGYEKFYRPLFRQMLKKNPWRALLDLLRFFQLHNIGPWQAWRSVRAFRSREHVTTADWLGEKWVVNSEQLFQRSKEETFRDTSLNLLTEVGLPVLLHYEDRNSMAASVESRLPFLDYRLVEFALALPERWKIHKARRKYILREAMQPFLPQTVYRRYDKMGFVTPQEAWMKKYPEYFEEQLKATVALSSGGIRESILDSTDAQLHWRVIAFGKWMKKFELTF